MALWDQELKEFKKGLLVFHFIKTSIWNLKGTDSKIEKACVCVRVCVWKAAEITLLSLGICFFWQFIVATKSKRKI